MTAQEHTIPRIPRDFFTKPIGALIKTTLVDFPGRVAASLFLKGCNLRCPYCYNWELIDATLGSGAQAADSGNGADTGVGLSTLEEVLAHLEKRRNVLTGFVISGGEPLLFPYLKELILHAKGLGYRIKLDTNGTLPERLQAIVDNPDTRPDFIAMDIKTAPNRYGLVQGNADIDGIAEKLEKSIGIISSLPAESREWRTVLVPPLVGKDDIAEMARLLPKDASWQFAQFRNENCLAPAYNDIAPYTDAEAADLVAYAQSLISGARLR